MTQGEILTAFITSLIASVVFWVVFSLLPSLNERRKMKPLLDFDLYQIYQKLFFFIEIPFLYSLHSPSFKQQQLFCGQLQKNDFELFLSTKCLTSEHQLVDEKAKVLIPVGEKLNNYSREILDRIQKIFVFNKYLSAQQILLCRKIADKIANYNYSDKAFMKIGLHFFVPVSPTLHFMSSMYYDLYKLFLELQDLLIRQKPVGNDFGNFYTELVRKKVIVLYVKKQYKKLLRITKGSSDQVFQIYYFRSLMQMGEKAEGIAAMKAFLKNDRERLIYQRSYFSEYVNDVEVKNALIEARSNDEYIEMSDCIEKERAIQRDFEALAFQLQEYFLNKTT